MTKATATAVIVGGGLNALGIVRSLAEQRVPMILVCSGSGPAWHSRYPRHHVVGETEGEALIAALKSIAASLPERPVLFLTEEKSVTSVSERRQELVSDYLITLPEQQTLANLMHKEGFQKLAIDCGSPVPAAVRLQTERDLEHLCELRFPCVLKPAFKHYGYGDRFKKAYVVASAAEASLRYREIAPVLADLVVQEWIEGADSDIYFCLQYVTADQRPAASFVGRKLRSWPPRIGGTASCIAAPECHDELSDMTSLFFRQVGFVGMGSMEYKRDCRDGRFYMVEPTVGRTDFQEEVATVNGVNIPFAAYCAETGASLPPGRYLQPPKIWRDPIVDRWSAEEQGSAGALPAADAVDAYWRANDPMPWCVLTWERVRARCQTLLTGRR
ncbi:MAG: FAD-dependent oxidoreductase [Accumulibacter sp.]|jgi:D-aspartate ligase|uniref:carboxylate--amine ligase n=1 Tax=Accumulibacter sp. TaxID=2053492 RepID=UPI002FC2F556